MDDIALISSSKEEIKELLRKVGEFCKNYGMKISKKSKYTSNGPNTKEEEGIKVQNIIIKNKNKNQACKYLGFWTALDGNWEKQKKKSKRNTKVR